MSYVNMQIKRSSTNGKLGNFDLHPEKEKKKDSCC